MLSGKRRALSILLWLVVAAALWALKVEVTFEHNVRRGIQADFRLRRSDRVAKWRI